MKLTRNISIIAHIDHGKTTLTDRLLLATDAISQREFHDRVLDSNPIEQERGITIELAPVTISHTYQDKAYTINLIDTPGHVDFGYEVSRSLAACEGAILLVDATQGIQAQTISNLEKARDLNLKIIVVLNKIDLPAADPEGVTADLEEIIDFDREDVIYVSAKTGENVDKLLDAICVQIPQPEVDLEKTLRALIFNSTYHPHKGVVAFVRVVDGVLTGQTIQTMAGKQTFDSKEVGIFSPAMKQVDRLESGDVGYIATGLKTASLVSAGDTITNIEEPATEPLIGYKNPQPMVYIDVYPSEGKDFVLLTDAIEKLALSDASLTYTPVSSMALGKGFRVGFLGALHAEIAIERIHREHNLELIPTAPTVVYQVTKTSGETVEIKTPTEFPDPSLIAEIKEPLVQALIYTPEQYLGAIMDLANKSRGDLVNQTHVGSRIKLEYLLPLSEIITSFFDLLKSASQGYASLEYEMFDYAPVEAVKLSILVNKEPVEALSQIVVKSKAEQFGKRIVLKLKDAIPRQNFEIPIQAAIGGTIVARQTVKAYRKDVTAKLYGGDITRRKKLLEKQKKGKAKRSQFAKTQIPHEAYLAVLKQ